MSDLPAGTLRQHTRRVELDNHHEYAVFDDRRIALDTDETCPTVAGARGELEHRSGRGEPDPGRTYRVLWLTVPREGQLLPGEEVHSGRR